MKNALPFLLLLLLPVAVKPQTVAQDWTLTDCNGNNHSLFADYLDNYKVVLMEFGMGCSTCGIAGQYFQQLKDKYAISHPGEFKFFYMDYWVPNDCLADVVPFLATWSMTPDASFEHCLGELGYYMPGSPMPGYVIAAGPYHAVYLNLAYFNNNDTAMVRATIDQALADMADVGMNESIQPLKLTAYPNPANELYTVQFAEVINEASLTLTDITGKVIHTVTFSNTNHIQLDVSHFPQGMYYVTLETPEQIQTFAVQITHE